MPTKPDQSSPHLDSQQLAARWHCSTDRIYKMRTSGEGPKFICTGARRYVYPIPWIEEWELEHGQSIQPIKRRRRRTKLKLA